MKDAVEFRIQDKTDRRPMFPEYTPNTEMELVAVGIAQDGTEFHRPSVLMLVREPGRTLVHPILLTAATFLTLAAGMKGAMERWGEPWTGA